MPPVARALLAIVLGVAVALGGTWGSELLVARLAPGAAEWLVLVLGRVVATFAGALTAARLVATRQALVATVVGIVMLAVTFLTLVARAYPFWFAATTMCGVIVAHLGARALARRWGGTAPAARPPRRATGGA